MGSKYVFSQDHPLHFATMTVVKWIDVFTRPVYIDIIYDAWRYCIREKGLTIHAYVIMSNHIHWIISTPVPHAGDIVRDFKRYTSRRLIAHISGNSQESRRDWMLEVFQRIGQTGPNKTQHQFWIHDNHPVPLWSPAVIAQKIEYIHQNPVRQGIVEDACHYRHSSARVYAGRQGVFPVSPILP